MELKWLELFYMVLMVIKYFDKTEANNVLVHLPILSNFVATLSAALSFTYSDAWF